MRASWWRSGSLSGSAAGRVSAPLSSAALSHPTSAPPVLLLSQPSAATSTHQSPWCSSRKEEQPAGPGGPADLQGSIRAWSQNKLSLSLRYYSVSSQQSGTGFSLGGVHDERPSLRIISHVPNGEQTGGRSEDAGEEKVPAVNFCLLNHKQPLVTQEHSGLSSELLSKQ